MYEQYEENLVEEVSIVMMPKVYPGKDIGRDRSHMFQGEGRSHAKIQRNGCRGLC